MILSDVKTYVLNVLHDFLTFSGVIFFKSIFKNEVLLDYVYLGTFLFCCLRVIGLYTVICCISLLCYKLQY